MPTVRSAGSRPPSPGAKRAGRLGALANGVAISPQLVAGQAEGIVAPFPSAASLEALAFYRIPLFLLPVYKAAAARYRVPWQVLAAINEVESDYGADLSVSSAGAVGWMQFMPETWLRYGVDALRAGYADPYNPVDAVFAAARYLRAAGARTDLRSAIFAYNHSPAYVASVLLRARLISSYPRSVIAALTALADCRPPVATSVLRWGGSPARRGGRAGGAPRLVQLTTAANAPAVAVQDGRVIRIGRSARLGAYLVLRDIFGDEFTYANLGGIARRYLREAVRAVAPRASDARPAPPVFAKLRLYAHPDNPDARAGRPAGRPSRRGGAQTLALRVGALVPTGAVLGRASTAAGASTGHLRFGVRPAGDRTAIDPRPLLANWAQLDAALHPAGAKSQDALIGATASDALVLSRTRLAGDVLSDPRLALDTCSRLRIETGQVDQRILAAIAFLSRSGLPPAFTLAGCRGKEARAGLQALDVTAFDGYSISARRGAKAIAGVAIRTLQTLPAPFAPREIWSAVPYPDAPGAGGNGADRVHLRLVFSSRAAVIVPAQAVTATAAQPAGTGQVGPQSALSTGRWDQLMGTIAALPAGNVARKPSAAAVADPAHA